MIGVTILLVAFLAVVCYAAYGITLVQRSFNEANKARRGIPGTPARTALSETEFRHLVCRWRDFYEYPRLEKRPEMTLAEALTQVPEVPAIPADLERADALRAQAYRRMLWSPLWPLLTLGDRLEDYRRARAGERVYALRKSTEALQDAQQFSDRLGQVRQEAQSAIDLAKTQD